MTLRRLHALNARIQQAAKAAVELLDAVKLLDTEVQSPACTIDHLAAHIFHSRAEYDRVSFLDLAKGDQRAKAAAETYERARRLGYQGSAGEWLALLVAGKYIPHVNDPNVPAPLPGPIR